MTRLEKWCFWRTGPILLNFSVFTRGGSTHDRTYVEYGTVWYGANSNIKNAFSLGTIFRIVSRWFALIHVVRSIVLVRAVVADFQRQRLLLKFILTQRKVRRSRQSREQNLSQVVVSYLRLLKKKVCHVFVSEPISACMLAYQIQSVITRNTKSHQFTVCSALHFNYF